MSTNYCGSYEHVQPARLLCLLYVPSGQLAVLMLQNRIMEVSGAGKLERQILCHKARTIIGTD